MKIGTDFSTNPLSRWERVPEGRVRDCVFDKETAPPTTSGPFHSTRPASLTQRLSGNKPLPRLRSAGRDARPTPGRTSARKGGSGVPARRIPTTLPTGHLDLPYRLLGDRQ